MKNRNNTMGEEARLIKSIRELTEQIKKSNSLWRNFRLGIFFGVGSALGASIIAGILFGTLAKIYSSFQEIPGFFE